MQPIIRIENLHHTFLSSSGDSIPALRGANLSINQGEYVTILGHNGSGKSTLAKHLNALLLPTEGDVWVKEWNTRALEHRRIIREAAREAMAEKVTVAGDPGRLYDMRSADAAGTNANVRMMVAVLNQGNLSWFFRLSGEADAAERQREVGNGQSRA